MSVSAILTRKIKVGSIEIQKDETRAEGEELVFSQSVAPGTNTNYAFSGDQSQFEYVFIAADGAVTLKTNNSGAPTDTITLAAGEAILWTKADTTAKAQLVCPFSADITTLYITNGGSGNVQVDIRVGVNPAL